jgi:hypothetical protein
MYKYAAGKNTRIADTIVQSAHPEACRAEQQGNRTS